MPGPGVTYTKFIEAGSRTSFFPQKFEGGEKILEAGRCRSLETVDRSSLWPPHTLDDNGHAHEKYRKVSSMGFPPNPEEFWRSSESGKNHEALWKEVRLTLGPISLDGDLAWIEKSYVHHFAKKSF